MKKIAPLLWLPVMAASLFSCSPKDIEYRGIRGVKIEKMGLDTSTAQLKVAYYNPNKFKVKLKKAELSIYADSNYIGQIMQDTLIRIPRKSDFLIPLTVRVPMQQIPQQLFYALLTSDIRISVNGYITIGKGFVYRRVPIHYESIQRIHLL